MDCFLVVLGCSAASLVGGGYLGFKYGAWYERRGEAVKRALTGR